MSSLAQAIPPSVSLALHGIARAAKAMRLNCVCGVDPELGERYAMKSVGLVRAIGCLKFLQPLANQVINEYRGYHAKF